MRSYNRRNKIVAIGELACITVPPIEVLPMATIPEAWQWHCNATSQVICNRQRRFTGRSCKPIPTMSMPCTCWAWSQATPPA